MPGPSCSHPSGDPDQLAVNIREAIGLHLEGEDLSELGFASNPTILATMELESVA